MSEARLTLGTAKLGLPYESANRIGQPDREAGERILRTAFELGIRSLDTAPGCLNSEGGSEDDPESVIGSFFQRHGRPDGVELCTKLPRLTRGEEVGPQVTAAVEGSRRRLASDTIDFYLLHDSADLLRHGRVLVEALDACRSRGWIQRIGVSVSDPEEAETALANFEFSAVQYPFNLFDRRILPNLERFRSAGYQTFARSPLLQGLFALPPADAMPEAKPWLTLLHELCQTDGLDPVELAIVYAVSRSGADRLVVGVDSAEQLVSVVEMARRQLAAELVERVEAAFSHVPREVFDPRLEL